jgi:hypothetical protein
MDRNQFELRSLVYFVLVCYIANLTFSIVGVASASRSTLLGITHGVGMASLGVASINVDRSPLMFMPMMPALVSMFWCTLLPFWLRVAGTIPFAFFLLVYVTVRTGGEFYSWPLNFAYGTLQVYPSGWRGRAG